MIEWIEEDYRLKRHDANLMPKHPHFIGHTQWQYMSELSVEGNFENRLNPAIIKLYDYLETYRQQALMTYKNDNYEIVDDYTFKRKKNLGDQLERDCLQLQPEI